MKIAGKQLYGSHCSEEVAGYSWESGVLQPSEVFYYKKSWSEKFRNIHSNTAAPESLFNKAAVFSCEYCQIFKNAYFEEHLQTAASGIKNAISSIERTLVQNTLSVSEQNQHKAWIMVCLPHFNQKQFWKNIQTVSFFLENENNPRINWIWTLLIFLQDTSNLMHDQVTMGIQWCGA